MPAPLVLCQIARLLGASAAATLADAIMAYCMRALTPVHRQVATSPRPSAAAPLTLLQASIHSSSPPSHFRLARGTYRASRLPSLTPPHAPSRAVISSDPRSSSDGGPSSPPPTRRLRRPLRPRSLPSAGCCPWRPRRHCPMPWECARVGSHRSPGRRTHGRHPTRCAPGSLALNGRQHMIRACQPPSHKL